MLIVIKCYHLFIYCPSGSACSNSHGNAYADPKKIDLHTVVALSTTPYPEILPSLFFILEAHKGRAEISKKGNYMTYI